MRLELQEYNVMLIDFEDIHKKFDKNLINNLHSLELLDTFYKSLPDHKKILLHFTIKETLDYLISVKTNNKLVLYFNNTQFYESEVFNYIDQTKYLQLLTSLLIKIRKLLPVKIVISSKSLLFFSELLKKDDGRAKGTLIRIINTINKFKIENFTFAQIKKYAKSNGLNFLSKEYFNNIKTKQITFK